MRFQNKYQTYIKIIQKKSQYLVTVVHFATFFSRTSMSGVCLYVYVVCVRACVLVYVLVHVYVHYSIQFQHEHEHEHELSINTKIYVVHEYENEHVQVYDHVQET
jgi:hypothetical protein